MSKLPEISSYEASFLKEASETSSAIAAYLSQKNPVQPADILRFERNQAWLKASLATLKNLNPRDICEFWSEEADRIVQQVFTECFQNQKISLFALGKWGSKELNLSSDIDLVFVCEEENASVVSGLRRFQKTLADRTAFGFIFRVDFDLRPGGRNGPLIPTLDQFRDYYGNYGETWERMAFVRLRPIAGDSGLQKEVMDFARKFTYRRHLDFTLLEDLKGMRQKIHAHYWARTQADQIDLKLGLGGIRDIELFIHALQVVHGGRDPELQKFSTEESFLAIKKKKLLQGDEADFLRTHYWNLRALENYVQSLADEQTHLLSALTPRPDLDRDMKRCDQLVSSLLGSAPAPEASAEAQNLSSISFEDEEVRALWAEIQTQEALSHSKQRDEAARLAFLEEFVVALRKQGGNLKQALQFLRDFVRETRAKATFFSMLLREKNLLDQLAWLFGHSPYLASILCRRPELLDSFVYRSQDQLSSDWSQLVEDLSEKKLLSEVINGSDFLKDKDILKLNRHLTSTADSIVLALLERLQMDYPTSAIKILALGKWGGFELGFRSDLDFIFVTPGTPEDADFKLARRLISRLTDTHKGGQIFQIDMRLRPSGKAGPLVMPEEDLKIYLQTEASPWERQAYLKSRWLGGEGVDLRECCIQRPLLKEDLTELDRIRRELLPIQPGTDLKYGEGGLIDIEFAAQILILKNHIRPPSSRTLDFLSAFGDQTERITMNYLRLRQIEQTLQLVASQALSTWTENHESFRFLAGALQTSPEDLQDEVDFKLSENLQILNELDPRRGSH